MFGTKIRSWMEAHIVRARKKQTRSKKTKGQESVQLPITEEKVDDVKIAKDSSAYSVAGKTEVNISSPESAYSTGYSTDGTSPGASVPPEYYINLRTGKHYVQATGNTAGSGGVAPEGRATPGRRRRAEECKRRRGEDGLPGSSTEEDIADRTAVNTQHQRVVTPKTLRKVITNEVPTYHRRTESYDGGNIQQSFLTERDSEGSSSTQTTGPSLQCSSPFLSASPRQRNRIRTNPWLGAEKSKVYNSQGETSSTVGSSSTLSSSGCKDKPPPRIPEEVKNVNLLRNGTYIASPMINGRRIMHTVTTCSPQPNRPCRHIRPTTSSSSTSARSSGSDDNHHGNTSDFSDDDVTLNEMGKYDESYVYEKETDILSDSDPTDCEEQPDYNDNSSRQPSERQDDLDFIDTGSIAELTNSDSEQTGKYFNRGHCTFVSSANHTPEMCKRQCSRLRRQRGDGSTHSSRGSSLNNRKVRRSSSRRSDELNNDVTPKRYRKKRQSSKDSRKSVESLPKECPPVPARTYKIPPIPEPERKILEQGRHMNLNRVLMERLIQNQRSGTRSADGTPVSLRRNGAEYNGKYLRNPHVSKLINSNNIVERRTNVDEKRIDVNETNTVKRRSNSLTGNSNTPPPVPPRVVVKGPNEIDKEGDIKYRKLIQEAEHIFEDFQVRAYRPDYLSPTLSTRSAIFPAPSPPPGYPFRRIPNQAEINSQIDLLQETINNNSVPKIENEEGIFKTISKTLEKIIIRNNSDLKKTDKNSDTIKSKKKPQNKPAPPFNGRSLSIFNNSDVVRSQAQGNDYVNNPIPVSIESIPDSNDNLYKDYSYSISPYNNGNPKPFNQNTNSNYEQVFRNKKGVHIIGAENFPQFPTSPKMIPRNKNNKAKDFSSSWHGRRTMTEINNSHNGNDIPQTKPNLTSFKSFDLGNRIDPNAKYCPQSEPVKRKVYVCSSTFDKLQKSLMRESTEKYEVPDLPTEALRDENTSLKEKVEQLRRERLQVEARVRETQEQIDRLRLAEASSHC